MTFDTKAYPRRAPKAAPTERSLEVPRSLNDDDNPVSQHHSPCRSCT